MPYKRRQKFIKTYFEKEEIKKLRYLLDFEKKIDTNKWYQQESYKKKKKYSLTFTPSHGKITFRFQRSCEGIQFSLKKLPMFLRE